MICDHCKQPASPGLPLVEYGGRRSGPMWLHGMCWEARAVAVAEAARVALGGVR